MKSLKNILSLTLLLSISVLFGQTDNILIHTPFYKSGFTIKPIIQDGKIVQLKITADGIGNCLTKSTIRIQFSDMTFLLLNENLSSNENCNSVIFDLTPEHRVILKKTELRKILFINGTNNKSIAGVPQNKWYFTDYLPYKNQVNI